MNHAIACLHRWLRGALPVLCMALAACSSQPPVPDWQMNAHDAAQKAVEAYLSGDARVEKQEFERARRETARTGQPALLARLELLRCAARVASVVVEPCTAFEALREDAAPSERAYAQYLAGQLPAQSVALLPSAQQGVAAAGAGSAAPILATIADPLSRLVAAGVLLQTGRADPAVMQIASDTASAQGWRRPLLAWLLLQAQRAAQAGDADAAARLYRRMALVEQGGATP
jgi:hypothetical protein